MAHADEPMIGAAGLAARDGSGRYGPVGAPPLAFNLSPNLPRVGRNYVEPITILSARAAFGKSWG